MSETAIEADRNVAVASPGMSMSSDPESSESLFGDAARSGGTAYTSTRSGGTAYTSTPTYDDMGDGTVFSTTDSSSSKSSSNEFDTSSDFEEPTIIDDSQFIEDDGTTFSTHESSSDDGIPPSADPEGGTSGGIISQLWDMFRGLTSDDDEEDK